MGYAPSNIGRFALKTQSSWGTAETSFAAANYVEASIFIPTPVQEALRTDATRGGYYAQRVVAGSKKDTTFTVSMPMHGFSDSTPSGDPGAAHPDALLVAAALGDFNIKGFASSAVTGGTASAPTVSDSDYILWVGQAVAVPISGGHSLGFVKTYTDGGGGDDTLTLLDDLSAAPSGSGDLLGSITDPMSNARTELRSPYSGRIIGMARNQVVMPGFAAFHVGISSAKVPEDDPDPEPVMSRDASANDDYVDGMSEEE